MIDWLTDWLIDWLIDWISDFGELEYMTGIALKLHFYSAFYSVQIVILLRDSSECTILHMTAQDFTGARLTDWPKLPFDLVSHTTATHELHTSIVLSII